jgi:hypothetical protein
MVYPYYMKGHIMSFEQEIKASQTRLQALADSICDTCDEMFDNSAEDEFERVQARLLANLELDPAE